MTFWQWILATWLGFDAVFVLTWMSMRRHRVTDATSLRTALASGKASRVPRGLTIAVDTTIDAAHGGSIRS